MNAEGKINESDINVRDWLHSDLESLLKYGNNKNIAANLTDTFPYPYTKEDGLKFIERATGKGAEKIFAISFNDEAIGSIGLFPLLDVFRNNAELGYWLAEPFWGKGIMQIAVKQMINFTFNNTDINRIFARPFGTNLPSQKVLEKCGFVLEAKLEGTIIKNNKIIDELIYAIRKS